MLKPYSGQFNKDELEIITGLMYVAQLKSKQEGFCHGMKYALLLLMALIAEKNIIYNMLTKMRHYDNITTKHMFHV